MNETPKEKINLSIIIAAWNGISQLTQCLSSLKKQITDDRREVIVVSNFDTAPLEATGDFDFAKYIYLSDKSTVPQLRAHGVIQARGKIIALTEDLGVFDSAWCEKIEEIHKQSHEVVGGTIDNSSDQKALDWAVFFYDYGKYMSPNQAGATDTLSGMNVSYKSSVFEQFQPNMDGGFFETFINEELKSKGCQIYLDPSVVIFHNKKYKLKNTINKFYHHARSYAARRCQNAPTSKRLLFIAASMVLPALLTLRTISRTIKKGNHNRELLISIPYLSVLMSSWGFGELMGYLAGEGTSGNEWK